LALRAFLDHSRRDLISAEVVYAFIEEDGRRIARLSEEIARLGKLPDNIKVHVIEGPFQDRFGDLLDELDDRGAKLAPTFAFIDPFGYTDAPMSRLSSSGSAEMKRTVAGISLIDSA
jgi:three-Cys-motif partner protein